ncbi:hypothetical protein Tco_0011048 [Tanacetum coccineum]
MKRNPDDVREILTPMLLGFLLGSYNSDVVTKYSDASLYYPNDIAIVFDAISTLYKEIFKPSLCKVEILSSNDRNIIVEDEEIVENESRYSETIVEEDESSDIGCNDETSNPGDRECEDEREIREEGEWMEYDHPLDLLDVRNDEVYEFLIEKMPSCSLNFNFRIEKEDPGNLKIPCMIGNVEANIDPSLPQVVFGRPFMDITKLILDREQGFITFTNEIKEVTFKTPYRDSEMDDLTSEGHDLLSFRVILSEDDVKGHLI